MTNRPMYAAGRLLACLLALVCLLGLSTAAGARVCADDGAGGGSGAEEYEPIDLTAGGCSLTVYPASPFAEFADDLKDNAAITVELYQVAEAAEIPGQDAYGYRFTAPFNVESVTAAAAGGMLLKDGVYRPGEAMSALVWNEIAQAAAAVVRDGGSGAAPVSAVKAKGASCVRLPAEGSLDKGLYLVLAHSEETKFWSDGKEDEPLTTEAVSVRYRYRYLPLLVSLPYKSEEVGKYLYDEEDPIVPEEQVMSSDEGPWVYELTLYLKPEQSGIGADLIIKKTLTNYRVDSPVIFVFQVDAFLQEDPDTSVYSKAFSVSLAADGSKATLAEDIPVGAQVTVKEIYSGASCKPSPGTQTLYSGLMTEDGLVIGAADPIKVVEFFNEGDGTNSGGGIEHRFAVTDGEHWDFIAMDFSPGAAESDLPSGDGQ